MRDVNSKRFTFIVSLVLSVVCSLLVSTAAILLRPIQEKNLELDRQKNVLAAAGLLTPKVDIEQAFKSIQTLAVNIETGDYKIEQEFDKEYFNNFKLLSSSEGTSIRLTKAEDIAGIARISIEQPAYLVVKDGKITKIILHAYGTGLWSTMYGFIALSGDGQEVEGLTFYDQSETPGLGGEIDNPLWKAQWVGKKVYNIDGEVAVGVGKGIINLASPEATYLVDSLSGATITSRGVHNLVRFWIGDYGYGKFLSKIEKEGLNGRD